MASISFGGEMTIELTTSCPNSNTYDYVRQTSKTEYCRSGRISKITGIGSQRAIVETDEDCGECRGTGEVLTYEGTMIVDMVRTWIRE